MAFWDDLANGLGYGATAFMNSYKTFSDMRNNQEYKELQKEYLKNQTEIARENLRLKQAEFDLDRQGEEAARNYRAGNTGNTGGLGSVFTPQTQDGSQNIPVSTGPTKPLPQNIDGLADYWARWRGRPDIAPLTKGVIALESGGDPWAQGKENPSDHGAMQINDIHLPEFQKQIPGGNLYNASDNIRYGTDYLLKNLDKSGGDARKALTGYHKGIGRQDAQVSYADDVFKKMQGMGQDVTPFGGNMQLAQGQVRTITDGTSAPRTQQQSSRQQELDAAIAEYNYLSSLPGSTTERGQRRLNQAKTRIELLTMMDPAAKAQMDAQIQRDTHRANKETDLAMLPEELKLKAAIQPPAQPNWAELVIQQTEQAAKDGTLTPEQSTARNLAYSSLSKEKQNPSSGAWEKSSLYGITPPAGMQVAENSPKSVPAESAGRMAALKTAMDYVPAMEALLFDSNGKPNKGIIGASGTFLQRFSGDAQQLSNYVNHMKNAYSRVLTGAGMSAQEVADSVALLEPKITDTPETLRQRIAMVTDLAKEYGTMTGGVAATRLKQEPPMTPGRLLEQQQQQQQQQSPQYKVGETYDLGGQQVIFKGLTPEGKAIVEPVQ